MALLPSEQNAINNLECRYGGTIFYILSYTKAAYSVQFADSIGHSPWLSAPLFCDALAQLESWLIQNRSQPSGHSNPTAQATSQMFGSIAPQGTKFSRLIDYCKNAGLRLDVAIHPDRNAAGIVLHNHKTGDETRYDANDLKGCLEKIEREGGGII